MTPQPRYSKEFSSAVLLWLRKDKSNAEGKAYWAGGHAQIIAASPGLKQYRQLHLSETEHSFWPGVSGLKTRVVEDRRIDGIADVTFQSVTAPISGRHQTALAFKDEVNVFRRTLMYAGLPGSARWYETALPQEQTALRDILFLQRDQGTKRGDFRRLVREELPAELVKAQGLSELRVQYFLPWHAKTWDTPQVAHDNPVSDRYQASILIGFEDQQARETFYQQTAPELNRLLRGKVSALHSFSIEDTKVFVDGGQILR